MIGFQKDFVEQTNVALTFDDRSSAHSVCDYLSVLFVLAFPQRLLCAAAKIFYKNQLFVSVGLMCKIAWLDFEISDLVISRPGVFLVCVCL